MTPTALPAISREQLQTVDNQTTGFESQYLLLGSENKEDTKIRIYI